MTIDSNVEILCKEIGTDATVSMFRRQLYRARTYCRKAKTKSIMDKYMADINRLEDAIRYAIKFDIKWIDSNNHNILQDKITNEKNISI